MFETTTEILETGAFWHTFYTKWLPQSGYKQPDEFLHENYATFNLYPAIEVYDATFVDAKSTIQIYAPIIGN